MMVRSSCEPAGRLLGRLSGLALLASGALLAVTAVAGPAGAAASHAPASSGYGWVRLAHLSPNTPPVNVYLYSYGKPNAMVVLHHVSYGTVSPYERVPHGEYTVAMRGVGASPSSTPVLSNNLMVHPGHAYTVAGVGPNKALRLQVLDDRLTTPKGKSLVRVIQASLKEHHVTVTAGSATLAHNLAFADVTGYGTDSPGTWMVHAKGGTEAWSGQVKLSAGHDPHPGRAGFVQRPGGHRPDGRRGQLGYAQRRRRDRSGRHRPGAGILAAALAGRAGRGRAAHPGRRLPAPPGQGRGPARPLREAGRPAPATPGLRASSRAPWSASARPGTPGAVVVRAARASRLLAGRLRAARQAGAAPAVRGGRGGLRPGRAGARRGRPGHADRPPGAGRRPGDQGIRPGSVRIGRAGPGPHRPRPPRRRCP